MRRSCSAIIIGWFLLLGSMTGVPAQSQPKITCLLDGRTVDLATCRQALEKADSESTQQHVLGMQTPNKSVAPRETVATVPAPVNEWNTEAKLFVRRSLDDLGSFASPSSLKKSAGAEFSYTTNRVNENDTWSMRGLVGARLLSWQNPSYSSYFDHALFGTYVQFDRAVNSKLRGKDIDDLVYGLSGEVALANFLQATHYLRTRGELVNTFDGDTKNWNFAVEYQPFGQLPYDANTIFAYLGTPVPLTKYAFLTVSPKARAEYRGSLDGSKDPIFASDERVLRFGPSVTLAIDGNTVFDDVPWFIRNMHFAVTYGALHDVVSNASYDLLDTSLTFALDEKGLLGLTFSYRRGELETTGERVDIAKVSLTAKYGE